jgi:hypothetical protein
MSRLSKICWFRSQCRAGNTKCVDPEEPLAPCEIKIPKIRVEVDGDGSFDTVEEDGSCDDGIAPSIR